MTLAANSTISHYRIISQIGEGGMGEVYLAEDTKLDRKVALKILPVEVAARDDRMRRFVQEAKAISALNHPNILTIYEIDETDSGHFIATEFIEGETLRERMRSAALKVGEAIDIATQIAGALSAAHEAGIIHRDIKPENIMLRRDGIVKVLDFGLAKLTERLSPDSVDTAALTRINTEPGVVMGTVLYMSPEQARGLQLDARTDIFSLGVVIYEMVAEHLPFEGSNTYEIIATLLNDKEASPLARYSREAPELERIIAKTLRKNRLERYQTSQDLLLDLKGLKERLQFRAEMGSAPSSELAATEVFSVPPSRGKSDQSQTSSSEGGTLNTDNASSAGSLVSGIKQYKRGASLILAALLLALAGIAYFFYFAGAAGPINSIAVLPLVNDRSDPNTDYLSDGITESIISNLSQLPQLKVMARSTVSRFKGKEIDPQKIGQDLNVRAVLTGRLLQQGESLVIRTELVNVDDGAQLWGAEYSRKISDVLAVQQDISREISERLRLRLTGEEKKRLTGRDSTNAEAYRFYLRGRYFWNKRTANGLKKAMEEFQQAIDLDPDYALGYVGLADCYSLLEEYAGVPASVTLPKGRAAADHALRIDDSLAEAHASSAKIHEQMWRGADAEEEYRVAIRLDPNYPSAHHQFSRYLLIKGRLDEALKEGNRAQELDPLSPVISANVASIYLQKNDLNSAIERSVRIIEFDSSFPYAYFILGMAYLRQQRNEEATPHFQKAAELSGRAGVLLGKLGYFYAVSGRRADALAILKELEEKYTRGETIGQYVADVYAGLGEKDQAFAWLEKDFQRRSGRLPEITLWFNFEGLRGDARYADLVRRMGLQL